MRAAAVQLNSTNNKDRNLETAGRLVGEAASAGATLVVLPEKFNVIGTTEHLLEGAEPLEGPTMAWAGELARSYGIWLVAGSIVERVGDQQVHSDTPGDCGEHFNTSCLVSPEGEIVASYRKIHMFDVEVGGQVYRESDLEQAGEGEVIAEAGELRLGLTICYDLRFPELYRILALRGARAISVPAAFTERTGRDHWEVLVRARAIENQVFMLAAGQIGTHVPGRSSYGRSMIVDPWGVVLACAPDAETYVLAELDFAAQDSVRERLPSLASRRPDAYRWPDGSPAPEQAPALKETAKPGQATTAEQASPREQASTPDEASAPEHASAREEGSP